MIRMIRQLDSLNADDHKLMYGKKRYGSAGGQLLESGDGDPDWSQGAWTNMCRLNNNLMRGGPQGQASDDM